MTGRKSRVRDELIIESKHGGDLVPMAGFQGPVGYLLSGIDRPRGSLGRIRSAEK